MRPDARSLAWSIFSGEAVQGLAPTRWASLLTELRAKLTAQIDALRRLIDMTDMKLP